MNESTPPRNLDARQLDSLENSGLIAFLRDQGRPPDWDGAGLRWMANDLRSWGSGLMEYLDMTPEVIVQYYVDHGIIVKSGVREPGGKELYCLAPGK